MTASALDDIRARATPLQAPDDLDGIVAQVGERRHVLIGEASHGTADYYRWRAALTRRLIEEKGFSLVAVEGDWPDCFGVNRWVKRRGASGRRSVVDVLSEYQRWPTWMWANETVARFVDWLRDHNDRTGSAVGFYGLDVYSLWDSLRVVLGYLERHRPDDLDAALAAARCFEPHGGDPHAYASSTRIVPEGCEAEVVELLCDVQRRAAGLDGEPEASLDAVQNAEVLRGAERYYRTMVRGGPESWNLRDDHMIDTLARLVDHHGDTAKTIVWEHNTHVGDARHTDMADNGMVNVGQLARQRWGDEDVFLVGLGGHRGTVIAGARWGAPGRRVDVPPAPPNTHEDLLHQALGCDAVIDLRNAEDSEWLTQPRGHRAIGVVYHPSRDHLANWVPTVLGGRYDAFISLEDTRALEPLVTRRSGDVEYETYPWTA